MMGLVAIITAAGRTGKSARIAEKQKALLTGMGANAQTAAEKA